jgi:hypothetical protein
MKAKKRDGKKMKAQSTAQVPEQLPALVATFTLTHATSYRHIGMATARAIWMNGIHHLGTP